MKRQFWDTRRHDLLKKVDELSGPQARMILYDIVDSIVTDSAGNTNNEFTYMWKKNWLEIEEKINGGS